MTTSVAKNIIIKQPNYLINNIINEEMRLNTYGIPSATEVVLFLELGKNKVSSHRNSIPLGMHPSCDFVNNPLCAFVVESFLPQRNTKVSQRNTKKKQSPEGTTLY